MLNWEDRRMGREYFVVSPAGSSCWFESQLRGEMRRDGGTYAPFYVLAYGDIGKWLWHGFGGIVFCECIESGGVENGTRG